MSKILVDNVEKNHFEKQPWEKLSITVDFTEDLGAGSVLTYAVNATDSSGTSVDTTVLAGYSESAGVVTVGVKGGTSGMIYTITSKVTSDQTLPDATNPRFEADVHMRVADQT
ncbi:MAG: hypothetical protein ABID54_00190 [Pseudomonadota bacterium]